MSKFTQTVKEKFAQCRTWKIFKIIGTMSVVLTVVAFWGLFIAVTVLPEENMSWTFEKDCSDYDNIARLMIRGQIVEDDDTYEYVTSSASIILEKLDKLSKQENIKTLILDIDSGGGEAVAGDEITKAIKMFSGKKVAVIRAQGMSSAYYIATAADEIYANEFSGIGSIGVTMSYIGASNIISKDGLIYEAISSGKYKDAGADGKVLTSDERKMLINEVMGSHESLVKNIAENRKKTVAEISKLADGSTYSGRQALALGLVDKIGTMDEVITEIAKKEGVVPSVCEIKGYQTAKQETKTN